MSRSIRASSGLSTALAAEWASMLQLSFEISVARLLNWLAITRGTAGIAFDSVVFS